jgi:L-ascorbate metabolism protein UlaG (beta-lactamase superfamily)
MFELEYKGGNCVVLSTKKTTMVVDPKLSVVGLKDIKTKDEVELATEPRFIVENSEARVIIQAPGEYEVGDFYIHGAAASRHLDMDSEERLSTVYHIDTGDIRMGLIGNIKNELDDDQLEAIGVVDILVLPIGGGGYTLDATSACSIVRQIEPKVVIPVHYADPGLHYEVPQDTLDTFTKELGAPVEPADKFKVKSMASLPQSLTVIPIKRS